MFVDTKKIHARSELPQKRKFLTKEDKKTHRQLTSQGALCMKILWAFSNALKAFLTVTETGVTVWLLRVNLIARIHNWELTF